MKVNNRVVFTFKELLDMGLSDATLTSAFYGRDMKKFKPKYVSVKKVVKIKVINQKVFEKYLKKLVPENKDL